MDANINRLASLISNVLYNLMPMANKAMDESRTITIDIHPVTPNAKGRNDKGIRVAE